MDRHLNVDYQFLIIFGMNIPDTTGHQMIICSRLTERLFLHYLGKTEKAKYYIFIQCGIII